MPCRIEISDMKVMLHIGCTDEEQRELQPILFRVTARNLNKFLASATDEIGDTVDVYEVQRTLLQTAKAHRVRTLERLGEILEQAFREQFKFRAIEWEIAISKPQFGWTYVQSWTS